MPKKRRRGSLGSPPAKHTHEAARDASRANSLALESARAASAGNCGTSLTALLGARGAAAAATAHIASGGETPAVLFHQNTERATDHFRSRCLRKG